MKIFLFLLMVLALSNCSFKKDQTTRSSETEYSTQTINLYKVIYSGNPQQVKEALAPFKSGQISRINLNGVSLFDATIERGNSAILNILLDSGLTPFTTNTQDQLKPYVKIHKLGSDLGATLGAWTTKKFTYMFDKENLAEITNDMNSLEMDCNDVLNLHSWYSQYLGISRRYSSKIQTVLTQNKCIKDVNTRQYSNWVRGEIITLLNDPSRDFDFLDFLKQLHGFQNLTLTLLTSNGLISIKPFTLLSIVTTVSPYNDSISRERLSEMLDYFEREERPQITLPDSSKIYIDLSDIELKEAIISSTSINSLKKLDACVDMCWRNDPAPH